MAETFEINIQNVDQFVAAFQKAPDIVEPRLQDAINASQAILASKKDGIVPMVTGNLINRWTFQPSRLMAYYFPTVKYAIYVNDGTAPHVIRAVNKKVLANAKTGQIFGRTVNHPGTHANPFMQNMVNAAQGEIDTMFGRALELITQDIANQTQ